MANQTNPNSAKMAQELKTAFTKAAVMLENASAAPVENEDGSMVNNFVQVLKQNPHELPDQVTSPTPPQCVTEIIRLLERFERDSQERILRAVVAFYGLSDIDV